MQLGITLSFCLFILDCRVHMDDDLVDIRNLFCQTTLHCLGDPVPLSDGHLSIDYDVCFHLVQSSRGSDPEVMHVDYPFHAPDAIGDFIQDLGLGGGVGKFT